MPIYFKKYKGRGFYKDTPYGLISVTESVEILKSHKSESLFYCDGFHTRNVRTKNELFNLIGDEEDDNI